MVMSLIKKTGFKLDFTKEVYYSSTYDGIFLEI